MKSRSLLSLSATFALAASAAAGNVSVSASAGSVAGMNTSSGTSPWEGLSGTASTAIIYYQTNSSKAATGDLSGSTSEFKCVDADGNFAPHTFNGVSSNGSSVVGLSTFSNPSNGAPEYYQASWTASSSSVNPIDGSGTYDPWVVTAGDVMGLGTPMGGTASLYYQTSLLGGFSNATGFNLAAGQTGSYSFRVGAVQGGIQKDFLNFTVNRVGNGAATFTVAYRAYDGFSLYALGANAHNDGANPNDRLGQGTAITNPLDVARLFAADLRPDGSLNSTLDFGLVYQGLTLNTSDRNTPLLTWNTTTLQTLATPEPAALIPLVVGTFALLRRRRRPSTPN